MTTELLPCLKLLKKQFLEITNNGQAMHRGSAEYIAISGLLDALIDDEERIPAQSGVWPQDIYMPSTMSHNAWPASTPTYGPDTASAEMAEFGDLPETQAAAPSTDAMDINTLIIKLDDCIKMTDYALDYEEAKPLLEAFRQQVHGEAIEMAAGIFDNREELYRGISQDEKQDAESNADAIRSLTVPRRDGE